MASILEKGIQVPPTGYVLGLMLRSTAVATAS